MSDSEDYSEDAREFRCLVPFPDQSENFTSGFEAGMIWQRMVTGEPVIGGLDEIALHEENSVVFQRMADAQSYDLTIEPAGEGWVIATFVKRQNRFRVIDGAKP